MDPWARVAEIVAAQSAMQTLGVRVVHAAAGECDLEFDFHPGLCQQDGFLHAGLVTTLVDTACGCAAATRMTAAQRVLTVEFKVNLLAPARGERFTARGRVVKTGRTLAICQGTVTAQTGDRTTEIALMQATMILLERPG